MNKKYQIIFFIMFTIIIGILTYILIYNDTKNSKSEVDTTSINYTIEKTINKEKSVSYYIQFHFKKGPEDSEPGTRVIFENIPLKDILVLSGEKKIQQERKIYTDEFIIDVTNLYGNYHLKYKEIDILFNDEQLFINGEKRVEKSLIIDDKQNIIWRGYINYLTAPILNITEAERQNTRKN